MSDIFISYFHRGIDFVLRVFEALEAHDHEPWVADYIHSNLLILKEGFSVIQR